MIQQAKKWQIEPQIKNRKTAKYHWIVSQLLLNRKISEKDQECFLNPDYEKCVYNPFLFRDMKKAVDLVIKHIVARGKIMIYGDYDADGVTASAIMVETLSTLKANVGVYIPDRVKEGYGLNKNAVKKIIEDGFKLIITVDGGIKSAQEVEYAKEKGIDVIITDHHTPPQNKKEIPKCLIINPFLKGEKYPFMNLVGAGVAFKFAKAIISKTKLSAKNKKILERRILDLAAIGTITDRFPLLGENRVIAREGLGIMNKRNQRIGLRELIKIAGLENGEEKINSTNIGFQLGPRINAAGRMESATTAFELLITRDKEAAQRLAQRLNQRNIERQQETARIVSQVEKQISEEDMIIIGVCPEGEEWNEGVIGLVAGKICEKYHKPSLVITKAKEGYKGSGRSIEGFNLIEALNAASQFLDRYGGHVGACGFSLAEKKLESFKKSLEDFTQKKLKNIDLAARIKIDALLELDELDEDLIQEINKLEPFGQENERPILASRNVIVADIYYMGINNNHIKIKVTNGRSSIIPMLGFGQAEAWRDLRIGDRIDIAYEAEINKFNGMKEVQGRIVDIKKAD